MYVHRIPLDKRPQGAGIVSSESDLPYTSGISKGCTVTLQFREVRIQAQVLEIEPDQFYIGQVVNVDGFLDQDVEGLELGSYLRFHHDHVFSAYQG